MNGKDLFKTTSMAATHGAAVTYLALFLAKLICKDCASEALDALAAGVACLVSAAVRFVRAKWNIKIPT